MKKLTKAQERYLKAHGYYYKRDKKKTMGMWGWERVYPKNTERR